MVLGILAALVLLCNLSFADERDQITLQIVNSIESQVVMPSEAASLAEYDRYYAVDEFAGRKLVFGFFVLRDPDYALFRSQGVAFPGHPGVFITRYDDLPAITDGGCSVITVIYDFATDRLVRLHVDGAEGEPVTAVCNGRA